jgi:C-terminal processing protease CtpA/Prc
MIGMETMDEISEYPTRVGILINEGNGSTDEQFLLEAKQSFKVKLFGRPTKGVLDISNVNVITSPDEAFNLHYSMSKSLRLPAFPVDDTGIQPDFFLDDEIKEGEWVEYVQNMLEAN